MDQPAVLRWRAKDASGRLWFVIEVSEAAGSGAAGKTVYKNHLSNQAVDPAKYTFFTDSGWTPGSRSQTWYRFCVTATDASGNDTQDCKPVKIT